MHQTIIVALLLLCASASASEQCKAETPALLKKATVTCDQARKAALAKVPGGKIIKAELEEEHGRLVYSFDVKQQGRSGVDEVQIDALDGSVVSVEHEDEATEKKEKHGEAAESMKPEKK